MFVVTTPNQPLALADHPEGCVGFEGVIHLERLFRGCPPRLALPAARQVGLAREPTQWGEGDWEGDWGGVLGGVRWRQGGGLY